MPEAWFYNLNIKIYHLPRVAFSIFGFPVYWYSIFILAGFTAGLLLAYAEAKRIGHDRDIYSDFIIIMLIVGIIGARAYYVIFSWDAYKANPLRIFNLREGGLAIYGGLIGVFIAGVIFAKVRKLNFGAFADVCVPCVAMGQAIGRFGNFVNREAFGGYTEGLFALRYLAEQVDYIPESVKNHMVYENGAAYIQVQPTFLYESMWNLLLFFVLTALARSKLKKFDGQILLTYFAGYGIGRFWIESYRTDQLLFFNTGLPVSQIVAAVTLLISVAFTVYFILRNKRA